MLQHSNRTDMSGYPEKKEDKSTAVRIPKGLIDEIGDFLQTRQADRLGFHHKSDVVSAAVRELLEKYNPRYKHLNMMDDNVKIIDFEKNKIATLYFRDTGEIFCDLDEKTSCQHIDYALEQKDIEEALKEHGWKRKQNSK